MSMTRRDAAAAVGAALAAGLLLRPGKAEAACPNIEAAIKALEAAQNDLKHAAHDFGGHRADALLAVDAALKQLGLCLGYKQCK
jgi:hypothetical protein